MEFQERIKRHFAGAPQEGCRTIHHHIEPLLGVCGDESEFVERLRMYRDDLNDACSALGSSDGGAAAEVVFEVKRRGNDRVQSPAEDALDNLFSDAESAEHAACRIGLAVKVADSILAAISRS